MDFTQPSLSKYINITNEMIFEVLKQYDACAQSKIVTTLELGFPNDVIRLAGGFAVGLYIQWNASIPFIPVDTTVNVCTTSLFTLSNDIEKKITPDLIQEVNNQIAQHRYRPNFDRGNHFIIYAKSRISSQYFLILHSDAYKRGYDTISPEEGNWYYDDIKTFIKYNRYLRYLIGDKAYQYYTKTKLDEEQNMTKHQFVANAIVGTDSVIEERKYLHHHCMPSMSSILIGGYAVSEHTIIPILTSPGKPIYLFRFDKSLDVDNIVDDKHFIVPHGWGKCFDGDFTIRLDVTDNTLFLNDIEYQIHPKNTFRSCDHIKIRDYTTSDKIEEYLMFLKKHYEGVNIDMLDQIISYSKLGYIKHI